MKLGDVELLASYSDIKMRLMDLARKHILKTISE